MPNDYLDKVNLNGTTYDIKDTVSGYTSNSGTVTSVNLSNGGGLSINGGPITSNGTITVGHSNSVTAQATSGVYPITIDAQGHIASYGDAVPELFLVNVTVTSYTSGTSDKSATEIAAAVAANKLPVVKANYLGAILIASLTQIGTDSGNQPYAVFTYENQNGNGYANINIIGTNVLILWKNPYLQDSSDAGGVILSTDGTITINDNTSSIGLNNNTTYTFAHSNSVTSNSTQALYPITFDEAGHITSAGSSVSIPTWALASTKPTYAASEITVNNYSDWPTVQSAIAGLASGLDEVETGKLSITSVGAANGVAPLNASSKIDETYLPSYVDDVIEGYYYNSKFWKESTHTTQITGEAGKIYVDLSTDKTYRFGGTSFVEISSGTTVSVTRDLTSGTKIATITVNGTGSSLYAPTPPSKVSELTNDSGFISGITSANVTNALGYTPYNSANPNGYVNAAGAAAAAPVQSVNSKTGAVTLSASDVGALPSTTVIPTVTNTYSSTGTDAVSGTAVYSALQTLDSSITATTNSAISAITITDGKITSSSKIAVPTVTSTYASNGTNAVNGTAVYSALQTLDSSITATANSAISAITITDGKISASSKIAVPSKTSDLTNDSGYLTLSTLPIYDGSVVTVPTRTYVIPEQTYTASETPFGDYNATLTANFTTPYPESITVVIDDVSYVGTNYPQGDAAYYQGTFGSIYVDGGSTASFTTGDSNTHTIYAYVE